MTQANNAMIKIFRNGGSTQLQQEINEYLTHLPNDIRLVDIKFINEYDGQSYTDYCAMLIMEQKKQ